VLYQVPGTAVPVYRYMVLDNPCICFYRYLLGIILLLIHHRLRSESTMRNLERLVLQHFDAYQRGKEVHKSHRTNGTVESRIVLLKEELQTLMLSSDFNQMSLEGRQRALHPQNELIASLLHCVDVAMATEMTNDSHDSISAILELASAMTPFGSPVAEAVIARSLKFTDVSVERVRAQACKLLGLCVEAILSDHNNHKLAFLERDEDHVWKDKCVNLAKDGLLPRLTDKSQAVRKAAITACGSFGDTMHSEMLQSLLWSLNHDPSAANRSAAIESVPCNVNSIDHLIQRVRDIKVNVRVDAIDAIRTKMNVADMTYSQFCLLIQTGLTDRCKQTQEATARLVCTSWIKFAKYDPIELIKVVGPIVNEEECEKIVGVLMNCDEAELLKDLSDPEIRAFQQGICHTPTVLSHDFEMTPEAALFARVKASHSLKSKDISASKKADILFDVIPDIPLLCQAVDKLVQRFSEAVASDGEGTGECESFLCRQLLQLAQLTDLKEEGSRRHFNAAMKAMLSSVDTPDDLLEDCIKAMSKAHDREVDFLRNVAKIVDDMTGGLAESYTEVAEFTRLRIISILYVVLENTSTVMATNPVLREFSSHITLAVNSADAMVRECGVGCLGRLAILSDESTVLSDFKPLLLKVASTDNELMEIRAQAMLALCDLSLLFEGILNPDPTSIVSLVSKFLHHSQAGVVAFAAEVGTKLLFSGKVHDNAILAGLLVAFFDKSFADLAEEEDSDVTEVGSLVRMQQQLVVFFPAYSMKSKEGKLALISSIGPMLNMITATKTKRGSTWNVAKIVEYIVSTVAIGKEQVGEKDSNDDTQNNQAIEPSGVLHACIEVSNFLIQHGDNINMTHLRGLCKLLGGADIDIDADHSPTVVALKSNIEELSLLIADDNSLRSLATVLELLEDVEDEISEDDANESDEESITEALIHMNIDENKENTVHMGKADARQAINMKLGRATVN